MSVSGELVYAVPRDVLLEGVVPWRGVKMDPDVASIMARVETAGAFFARAGAEVDRSIKQIIPYLVLRDGERIFLMKRTRAGGDARLHDHYTVGVGGHMNPGDESVIGGLVREWQEELVADFVPDFAFLGLLNDDEVEVGLHHLGVVFVAEAGGRPVSIRETDKLSGSFELLHRAQLLRDSMETWSQLVLDALENRDPATEPATR